VPISTELLSEGEEVLVDMRPHWIFFTGPALLTLVALVGAIAIGTVVHVSGVVAWLLVAMVALPGAWLAWRAGRWLGMSLIVTNFRIIVRRGVLGRDMTQLRLQRVTEVHMNQSLIERIVGSGQLVLDVQGGDADVTVDDVRRPRSLQRVLNSQLDRFELPDAGIARTPPPSPVHTGGPAPARPDGAARPLPFDQGPTPPHGTARAGGMGTAPGWSAQPQPHLQPAPPVSPAPAPPAGSTLSGGTVAEQLIALDDLRRRGIVTDEEFQAKKAELLDRL
jgi:hypothetical protein